MENESEIVYEGLFHRQPQHDEAMKEPLPYRVTKISLKPSLVPEIGALATLFDKTDLSQFFRHFREKRNTFSFHVLTHLTFYETFKEVLKTNPFGTSNYRSAKDNEKQHKQRTRNYGYTKHKKSFDDRVKIIKCKDVQTNGKTSPYTNYTFPALLFDLLLSRIMVCSDWRYTVRNLAQIPPPLYQGLRLANVVITNVFPFLSKEREELRSRLYPVVLDQVVCVLRILNYQGKHEEKEETQMIQYYKGGEEEGEEGNQVDEIRSDLSILEDVVEHNGGSLSLVHPNNHNITMKNPLFTVFFDCEYNCYTISATVFTLAVELTSSAATTLMVLNETDEMKRYQDSKLTGCYIRMRAALSSNEKFEKLTKREKDITETLLRVLSKNPSSYQHLPDSEKVLAILEFFKNIRDLIQLQVGITSRGKLKMQQGQFHQFEGPLSAVNDPYILTTVPGEVWKEFGPNLSKDTVHAICFRADIAEPLSISTSLHILQKRFEDSDRKLFRLFVDDIGGKTIVIIDKTFHRNIINYYMPYLCTSPTFIKRPGNPGMIYPIHVNNYFFGGRKGLLYSMKSLLRLFCRTTVNTYRSFIPSEQDEELAFFTYLYLILERFSLDEKGEWNARKLLCLLDKPFLNPLMLKYTTKLKLDKDEKTNQDILYSENTASHLNPFYPTIYTGIKSLCFMKATHDIHVDVIHDLYHLFRGNDKFQNKWYLVWLLVSHLKDCIERSKFPDSQGYIRIPKDYFNEEHFPFPNYLIFYVFIATEREFLTAEMAFKVFLGIMTNYTKTNKPLPTRLASVHPKLEMMTGNLSSQRYKDYFSTSLISTQFKRDPEREKDKRGFALTVLFEYLEQNSYYPIEKTFTEIGERASDPVRIDYESKPFDRWLPLYYDSVVSQKERPFLPAYFDKDTSKPFLFHNIFPLWKSEFLNTRPGGKEIKFNLEQYSNLGYDLRPLVGCHTKFLELINFHTCHETIQLLPTQKIF